MKKMAVGVVFTLLYGIQCMSQVLFFPSAQAMETDFQRCCATQQVKLNLGNISIPYLFLWGNFMINEKKNKFLKT
jgi:hypothetical protein